jgi:toxin ParE1/3/4
MTVRYRKQALGDIRDIRRYLHERSPSGAINVFRAFNAAIDLIEKHPLAAPPTSRPAIRVKVVTRYPYKIFYSVVDDGIVILHIRHTSRAPWL